jgi:hypothetical protein
MARKVILVSDITGTEAEESEFTRVVVRDHPASGGEAKALDILPGELDKLKAVENIVTLEVGNNGEKTTILCTVAELRKLVPDDVIEKASGTRGRPLGWTPKAKS